MKMGLFSGGGPISAGTWKNPAENPLPFAGLASSLREEHDYEPEVEGKLPADLRGSLYRNGPGLFHRGDERKRMLLDGDGMIRAYDFREGKVRYRNRFVRTEKFRDEDAANRFLYATWSTLAPGGMLANMGARAMRNQAGVSVTRKNGSLYAFDEGVPPYELDPETLETRGPAFAETDGDVNSFAAHSKTDGENGDWLHFGMRYGRKNYIQVTILDKTGKLKTRRLLPMDEMYYLHDWLVTSRHLIFILHPAIVPGKRLFGFLSGNLSFTDAIRWDDARGNRVMVIDRDCKEEPRFLEAPAAWCWHTLNAYENKSGEIIGDFVATDGPAGIGSENAPLERIMSGDFQDDGLHASLRRYVISGNSLREEIVAADDEYEMPFVHPSYECHKHRFGYFACRGDAEAFWSKITRMDYSRGETASYNFGPGKYCMEPVFVPREGGGEERGYLLTEVYDGHAKKNFLAVLDAENPAAGPLALVRLRHHAPLSFHGCWYGEK